MTAEMFDLGSTVRDYMRAGISEGVSLQRTVREITDRFDVSGSTHVTPAGQIAEEYTWTPKRPSWDSWALSLASVVATRADCSRAKVGAVILAADHRVLSVGFNGLPAGIPGCASAGNCPRGQLTPDECARDSDYANCAASHAERHAIEYADPRQIPYATMYVTRRPCPACTTLITAAGIARVVTPEGEMV